MKSWNEKTWSERLCNAAYNGDPLDTLPGIALAAVSILLRGVTVILGPQDKSIIFEVQLDRAFGADLVARIEIIKEEVVKLGDEAAVKALVVQKLGVEFIRILNSDRPDKIV